MRQPKLRKKKVGEHTYWFTEANDGKYFGRAREVPYSTAKEHFAEHIKKKQVAQAEITTVGDLFSAFLTWVKANRSDAQYRRRRRDCSRFAWFWFEGRTLADLPATRVTGRMLEVWRENLRSPKVDPPVGANDRDRRGLNPQTLLHSETSIRHAFSWGRKHNSPATMCPQGSTPFPASSGRKSRRRD